MVIFMNNDLISIIVPVYKVEKYINKCVDSIINQTYKNLEIILVDDGSPDNCPKICDEYAEKDDRVKVIHKKNGGLSEARNLGLEMAKGKYIGFVDSDDWIDYDMYEYLYNQLIINDCQVAVCGIYDVYEHDISKDANINKNFDEITILSNEQAVFECFNDCNINSFAWNKLYSKNVFENIRYPVGKRFEDMFVTHKIFSLCERIVCLPNKKYYYLRRDGSICSMQHEENSIAIFEAYTDRFEFAKQHYHNCKDTILKKLTELGV